MKFGIYNHVFGDLIDRGRGLHFWLLPEVVETGDFSLWRSPVAEKVIKLINCWRKKEAAKGSKAGLPMRQEYTQVKSTLPTMLKFSKAL